MNSESNPRFNCFSSGSRYICWPCGRQIKINYKAAIWFDDFKVGRFVNNRLSTNETKIVLFLTAQPGCSAWRHGSLVSVFWNAPMLRDTARRFLLLYLVVDVIINPVDIASGKSTRCSKISFLGLNLPTTCYHGSINNLKASKVLLKF